ncbi:hypothetical protein D3C73_858190 [compost metagenome]
MPAAFSPCINAGLIIASEILVMLTLPLILRRTCGSTTCTLPSNWPLLVSLINQSACARPLASPALRFSLSKAIGSALPCTCCTTFTPLPTSETFASGNAPPGFQLTSARPLNTPLRAVSGPRKGLIIARSKRFSTTLA